MDAWLVKAWCGDHFTTRRFENHKLSNKLPQGTQWKQLPPFNIHQTETQNKTKQILSWDSDLPRKSFETLFQRKKMLHATKQNNIPILPYLKSPWQLRLELMGFIFNKHVSSFLFVVFLWVWGVFFFSPSLITFFRPPGKPSRWAKIPGGFLGGT